MTGVCPGFPEDFGDWSVAGVFYESARLMKNHFTDMLLIALLFTFPASMMKVWHTQFYLYGRQDSIWTEVLVNVLDKPVALLLSLGGMAVTSQVLCDRMYPEDGCSKPFFKTMTKTATVFRTMKAPTDSETPLLNEAPTTPDPTKPDLPPNMVFKEFVLCLALSFRIWTTGVYFSPEAVAEMGLPPWTAFAFTALVGAYTGLSTSYFHLTSLLFCSWADVPRSTPRVKSCGQGCGDLHVVGVRA